jgi:hypothetical protein
MLVYLGDAPRMMTRKQSLLTAESTPISGRFIEIQWVSKFSENAANFILRVLLYKWFQMIFQSFFFYIYILPLYGSIMS